MALLKQSTARNIPVLMVQTSDHVGGLASLTLTITASKDGGAFATITPTVTDRGSGWYNLALDTTMTNTLGALALHITGTAADPTDVLHEVVAQLPGGAVTDSIAELTQAAPPATPTMAQAVMLLYMALRNQLTTTSTSLTVSNDAGTVICKSALSDDSTTFTRAELVAGP